MYFDRFDICEAWCLYATLWHAGQGSKEYAIFGRLDRIGFCPSPLFNGRKSLTDNGKAIYDRLVRDRTRRDRVRNQAEQSGYANAY